VNRSSPAALSCAFAQKGKSEGRSNRNVVLTGTHLPPSPFPLCHFFLLF
jgi:hypothetical protein